MSEPTHPGYVAFRADPDACRSPPQGGGERGIYVECADDCGTGLLFDAQGRAEFCQTNPSGSICEVEKRVNREMTFGEPAFLWLVLEHSLMEVYLDDILIECFSLPARATGRIGLIQGGEGHAISDLVAATCNSGANP